jgi:hypothetical protein
MKFRCIILFLWASLSLSAQSSTQAQAIEMLDKITSGDLFYGSLPDSFLHQDVLGSILIKEIAEVYYTSVENENAVRVCFQLLFFMYYNTTNSSLRKEAFNTGLQLKPLGISGSEMYRETLQKKDNLCNEFARYVKPSDFSEQSHIALTDMLKTNDKRNYKGQIALAGQSKDPRYIPIIKSKFLNDCSPEPKRYCIWAKCILFSMGEKEYKQEVFDYFEKQDKERLLFRLKDEIYFFQTPEMVDLLLRLMNDENCKCVYDFDYGKAQPCTAKTIELLTKITDSIPAELTEETLYLSANREKLETAKHWINEHKSSLKLKAAQE